MILFELFIIFQALFLSIGTQIGKRGRWFRLILGLLFIIDGIICIAAGIICYRNLIKNIWSLVFLVVLGLLTFFAGIASIYNVRKEASDKPVTERLTDVNIIVNPLFPDRKVSYWRRNGANNRIIEGINEKGEKIQFLTSYGADNNMADLIDRKNIKEITITYYPSTRTIKSIEFEK